MEDIIKHAKIYFTTLWYMEVVFLKSSFKVKRKTSKYSYRKHILSNIRGIPIYW